MVAVDIDVEDTQEKALALAERLPEPKGYQMLLVKPEIRTTTAGGIALADETRRKEEAGAVVGLIIKMGDMCYKDEAKFPTGPWAAIGDFAVLRAYSGSRFSADGKEFIIINDDQVLATVADPRALGRAY